MVEQQLASGRKPRKGFFFTYIIILVIIVRMRVKKIKPEPVEPMRDRWTVIDVDEEAIALVKKYAKKYNKTTGNALSTIIKKALS